MYQNMTRTIFVETLQRIIFLQKISNYGNNFVIILKVRWTEIQKQLQKKVSIFNLSSFLHLKNIPSPPFLLPPMPPIPRESVCRRGRSGRLSYVGRVMPLKTNTPLGGRQCCLVLVLDDTIILQLSYYILVMGRFYLPTRPVETRPQASPAPGIFAHCYLYGRHKTSLPGNLNTVRGINRRVSIHFSPYFFSTILKLDVERRSKILLILSCYKQQFIQIKSKTRINSTVVYTGFRESYHSS